MPRRTDSAWAARLAAVVVIATVVMVWWPAAAAAQVPAVGVCSVPGAAVVCDGVASLATPLAGEAVNALAAGTVNTIPDAVARWIAEGSADLLTKAGDAVLSGTEVGLLDSGGGMQPWFASQWRVMVALAAGFMAPMLVLATVHAAISGNPGLVWRALANLPVATLGTAVAVTVVQLLSGIVDAAAAALATSVPADTEGFLVGLADLLAERDPNSLATGPLAHPFAISLLAVVAAVLAFVLWIELVIRQAAIYLAVLFLPLGFAALIWPALGGWLRRLVEIILGLLLAKLVIVGALSLAASALANQTGFPALVSGVAMLLLAVCAPFALFSLIPLAGLSSLGGLEGRRQAALRPFSVYALSRLTRR